jgi:DNA mismatch endonuclease (patch repair protein)
MRDRLSKERRSWNMSRIRGKNTLPEMRVRSLLHRMGYRFRLHRTDLPGKPDVVFVSQRVALFVHGCFWHRHPGCKNCTSPTNNRTFWRQKLEGNAARDKRNRNALRKLGWISVVIWECETENPRRLDNLLIRLARKLDSQIQESIGP